MESSKKVSYQKQLQNIFDVENETFQQIKMSFPENKYEIEKARAARLAKYKSKDGQP